MRKRGTRRRMKSSGRMSRSRMRVGSTSRRRRRSVRI